MPLVDRSLVGAEQPSLDQRGDPVDAGEQAVGVLAAEARCALAVPFAGVAEILDAAVALPGVGDDRGAGADVVGDEGVQRSGGRVGKDRHPAPPEPLGLPNLDSHSYQRLLALLAAAPQPRLLAADERLVDLHATRQPLATWSHEHRAQPVQHGPCRLVGADLEGPLQALRREPVLLGGEKPTRHEPHRERGARLVEDGSRRHRCRRAARPAAEPPVAQSPAARLPACRAHEPVRPAQPLQVIQTVGVGAEPRLELAHRTRVIPSRQRRSAHGRRNYRASGPAKWIPPIPVTPLPALRGRASTVGHLRP